MKYPKNMEKCTSVRKFVFLGLLLAFLVDQTCAAWMPPASRHFHPFATQSLPLVRPHSTVQLWAKKKKSSATNKSTGGGGGFGASTATTSPTKQLNKKQVAKRIAQTYGGTSPQEIARGTQQRIDASLQKLPPQTQVALQLYQQLQKWNLRLNSLTVLEHASLSQQELDGAKRAQEELDRILNEQSLTTDDLHNIYQQVTWDASADAKAARALTGKMPADILKKVDTACSIVAETVGENGKCLDVGCGYGVLVPSLKKNGLDVSQIYGVDLSPEMIRNAQEQHRGVSFEACDFQEYTPSNKFDAIIFCSSLHDLPNAETALAKAASLLADNGKIVVAHPQGAQHVARQHSANPVMVQSKLPAAQQLSELADSIGLQVEKEPAVPGFKQEDEEGYLAVLVKK